MSETVATLGNLKLDGVDSTVVVITSEICRLDCCLSIWKHD
jgi:hypothetical protein